MVARSDAQSSEKVVEDGKSEGPDVEIPRAQADSGKDRRGDEQRDMQPVQARQKRAISKVAPQTPWMAVMLRFGDRLQVRSARGVMIQVGATRGHPFGRILVVVGFASNSHAVDSHPYHGGYRRSRCNLTGKQ